MVWQNQVKYVKKERIYVVMHFSPGLENWKNKRSHRIVLIENSEDQWVQ